MKVGRWIAGTAAAGMAGAAGEYALARAFFRRALIRGNTKLERTQEVTGTNWSVYIPQILECRERLRGILHEDVYIRSADGCRLHGVFFPQKDAKRAVLCFHGYTSRNCIDYAMMAEYYWNQGFSLLCVDARAHGESEGKYIGFGCLDRYDAEQWTQYLTGRLGEDCRIMLHGVSMGAATVLMASGLCLPEQVKGIIADCAYTSVWEVFRSVLKTMHHLPSFPTLQIVDRMARREAGYGLNDCDAREEVKKSRIPTVFIHGSADTFVPCGMVYELYEACAAPKELLVVKDAAHLEAYYQAPEQYQALVQEWIDRYFSV